MNAVMENYGFGLPVSASVYADQIDFSIIIVHIGIVVIFLFWLMYMLYHLNRARKIKKSKYHTDVNPVLSYGFEGVMVLAEVLLVVVLAVPTWSYIMDTIPNVKTNDVVQINVHTGQFFWIFHYPGDDKVFGKKDIGFQNADNPLGLDYADPNAQDDVFFLDRFYIPVNKKIVFYTTSQDVIHSFFIPEFRIKKDIVPGMRIPIWVESNRIGQYELVCAELCGAGHYRMKADVYVQSEADFKKSISD